MMRFYMVLCALCMVCFANFSFASTTFSTGAYSNNEDISTELSIPGAQAIIVSIVGETESGYDFITIFDEQGNEIESYSGTVNDHLVVNNDTLSITFTSDGSTTKSGVTVSISESSIWVSDWNIIDFDHNFNGLTQADNGNYYIVQADDKIIELDGENLATIKSWTIEGAERLNSITSLNGFLWVGDIRADKVFKVDLEQNSLQSFSGFDHPDGIGTDGNYIYVVNEDESGVISILDPDDGKVLRTLDTSVPDPVGITFDGNKLIILDESGDIFSVDRNSGTSTYFYSAPIMTDENSSNGPEGIFYIAELLVVGYGDEHKIAFGYLNQDIDNLPDYPVLFVHGLNSSGDTWNSYLDDWGSKGLIYGGKIQVLDKFHVFEPGDNANSNSNRMRRSVSVQSLLDINVVGGDSVGDFYFMDFSNNNDISFFAQGLELTKCVDEVLNRTGANGVYVVSHSMGGLATRVYLQFFNDDKIKGLITIGTPHFGSVVAHLLPDIGVMDVEPQLESNSDDLSMLNDIKNYPLPNNVNYFAIVVRGKDTSGLFENLYSDDSGDGIVPIYCQSMSGWNSEEIIIEENSIARFEVHTLEPSDTNIHNKVWDVLLSW